MRSSRSRSIIVLACLSLAVLFLMPSMKIDPAPRVAGAEPLPPPTQSTEPVILAYAVPVGRTLVVFNTYQEAYVFAGTFWEWLTGHPGLMPIVFLRRVTAASDG